MSAPAKKAPAAAQQRLYVVLRQDAPEREGEVWSVLGEAEGSTDRQAIANLIGGASEMPQEGKFVAVPVRSWRPTERHVKTVEKAVWS